MIYTLNILQFYCQLYLNKAQNIENTLYHSFSGAMAKVFLYSLISFPNVLSLLSFIKKTNKDNDHYNNLLSTYSPVTHRD